MLLKSFAPTVLLYLVGSQCGRSQQNNPHLMKIDCPQKSSGHNQSLAVRDVLHRKEQCRILYGYFRQKIHAAYNILHAVLNVFKNVSKLKQLEKT